MARTYDQVDLALKDPSDLNWALAYTRLLIRDKPNEAGVWPEDSLEDEEIRVALAMKQAQDKVANGGDDTIYYFPHRVAAQLITDNPRWIIRFAVAGYSETYQDPSAVAQSILRNGRDIVDLIQDSTEGRIGATGLLLTS